MRLLVIIFLFLLTSSLRGQDRKIIGELSTTGYFIDNSFRAIAVPRIAWATNNRTIGFGPTFQYYSFDVASDESNPKLTGLQGNYKYYPIGETHKFDFFVNAQITLQRIDTRWSSSQWNDENQRYLKYNYISSEYLGLYQLGYGIQFRIIESVHIFQNFEVGFYHAHTDGDETTEAAPEPKHEDENQNGYGNFGFTYGFSGGLKVSF